MTTDYNYNVICSFIELLNCDDYSFLWVIEHRERLSKSTNEAIDAIIALSED